MGWVILAVVWLACGVVAAGCVYASLQREFPTLAERDRNSDRSFAALFLVFGPLGLSGLGLAAASGPSAFKFGWLWPWPLPKFRLEPPAEQVMEMPEGVIERPLSERIQSPIGAHPLTEHDKFTLRPNWDEAPEWAMWAAQDGKGCYWFRLKPMTLKEVEPDYGLDEWARALDPREGQEWEYFSREKGALPNWRLAIEQRPRLTTLTQEQFDERARHLKGWSAAVSTPVHYDTGAAARARLEAIEKAALRYVKRPDSQRNFERLAKALGVEL